MKPEFLVTARDLFVLTDLPTIPEKSRILAKRWSHSDLPTG